MDHGPEIRQERNPATHSGPSERQVIKDSLADAAEAKHGWVAQAVVEDVSADLDRITSPFSSWLENTTGSSSST